MKTIGSAPRVFESISVANFRGLQNVTLAKCAGVNLLVGGNNSGKTSLLEALILIAGPRSIAHWHAATSVRGSWPLSDSAFKTGHLGRLNTFSWLFPRRDGEVQELDLGASGACPVHRLRAKAQFINGDPPLKTDKGSHHFIEGVYRSKPDREPEPGLELELRLDWNPDVDFSESGQRHLFPPENYRIVVWERARDLGNLPKGDHVVPVAYATPVSHRSDGYLTQLVSKLIRSKRKDHALELLRGIDPNVRDLVLLSPAGEDSVSLAETNGQPTLHAEYVGAGLIPIHAMGDGLRRAVHFASLLADVGKGGVVVIDEMEVGMHTSVLKEVFGWLGQACAAAEVQLFATSHSLEAVDAILQAVPDNDLVLYRLGNGNVRRYEGDLLRTARVELGHEVR